MNSRHSNRAYRYAIRTLAIISILSIAVGIALITRGLILDQSPSPYQSLPGMAAATVALLSLAARGLVPRREEKADLREFARKLNRSRLELIREEIRAALFNNRKSPIDIRLTVLKGSVSRPARHLMRSAAIGELFASTPYGRMSIVGLPGAGKSLLALQLTLQAAQAAGDEACVPVMVPAQTWDQRMPSLDYWLIRQVANLLDIDRSLAWSLIKENIVLSVIDGLDEMDTDSDESPNAAQFIEALNGWNRRFLVTCRTDTWQSLESRGVYLEDACKARLEPLTSGQAIKYLEERNQPYGQKSTPFTVLKDISRILGPTLSTPFDLALIGSLLDRRGSIEDLMARIGGSMTSAEIESELLASFIEARARWYPKYTEPDPRWPIQYRSRDSRHYSVSDVLRWSRSLASFLQETGGKSILGKRMSTTAISVERLWPIAGLRGPRIMDQLITIALWSPLLAFLGILMRSRGDSLLVTLGIVGSTSMLPLSSMWANRAWVHPSKIVFQRLLQPRRLFRLIVGLSLAIAITEIGSPGVRMAFTAYYGAGFAISFALGIATAVRDSIDLPALASTGFAIGLIGTALTRVFVVPTGDPMLSLASGMTGGAISLVIGVKAGIHVAGWRGGGGLDLIPAGLPTPLARLKGDFQTGLIAGLLTTVTGIIICLVNQWPVKSTGDILVLCVLSGIAAGPGYAAATWRRHVAMLLCARGKLPFRLAKFFTWAHSVGLLRIAGRSYEFRHRRIQDWLVQ